MRIREAVRFHVLTLFPAFFVSPLSVSLIARAIERRLLEVEVTDIRDFAPGKHRVVDEPPYGGGGGMVLKVDVVVAALEAVAKDVAASRRILLTPRGSRYSQAKARELASLPSLVVVCGHYEGVDERVRCYVDEELSIGDYVLAGGETAALVIIDSVSRLLPGFVGNEASVAEESFESGLLEWPQYTRPEEFRGARVPPVLLSGDHRAIARWRRKESLRATRARRPDLFGRADLDDEDRKLLAELD